MKVEFPAAVDALEQIFELELAGVVRFTHYALMARGPHRIPIVEFFDEQASESLTHAQRAGQVMTGLGAHPKMHVGPVEESGQHGIRDLLEEAHAHERRAIDAYRALLEVVADKNIFLEEYARGMVATEEEHLFELSKMLRDFE